ncbi:MAG: hypothetical protein VYA55_16515 [Pseudomonadota bacterium]|nr:hypothetical protein [Pseudomonadota bacterium]
MSEVRSEAIPGALLLLADSQLLFRGDTAAQLQQWISARFPHGLEAAYLGAANGDDPVFFELACGGINRMLRRPCQTHWVRDPNALPPPCALVLLAGGSVAQGWHLISQPRVGAWLQRCRNLGGSLVIGISAGAIHLANGVDPEQPELGSQSFLDWLPYHVAVHEESLGWPSLVAEPGIGIPLGSGAWIEPGDPEHIYTLGQAPLVRRGHRR